MSTVRRHEAHRSDLRRALLAGLCTLAACTPKAGTTVTPTGFCVKPVNICTPDPGAPPVDCAAAETGLEFAPADLTIADFEAFDSTKGFKGEFMYSYTDATAQIYANRGVEQTPVGYEPEAETANVCTSDTQNHVLHITGGHVQTGIGGQSIIGAPFVSWGGGIGVAMAHLNQKDAVCPLVGTTSLHDFCPASNGEQAIRQTTLDMSQWDGVAVWARRGPDSQPLLRVLVGNKYVDEDINYKQYLFGVPVSQHYCERVRECDCNNGKACTLWGAGDAGPGSYYCGDPAADPPPGAISGSGMTATNSCNTTHCNEEYPAYPGTPDPQFVHRPCYPYAFRNGSQGSYCWDPDPTHLYALADGSPDPNGVPDRPPAESDQQCGDYWTFPLNLSTEWQLFLVPFTTMTQQGWAKRQPFFDISSVSVVRLTWDAGWVDYWIDNLRFYRVRS